MSARAAGPRLLLVTDPAYPDDRIAEVVAAVGLAVPRGSFGVQLRDKVRERVLVARLAVRLRDETSRCGALFIVNGDARLAREVGADGVHLGRQASGDASALARARSVAGDAVWISVATHDDAEVQLAAEAGADAVLVSPVFETPGKGPPRGLDALGSARQLARDRTAHSARALAIYALGGVTPANAELCRVAGADGIAVIRALLDAPDPGLVARALVGLVVQD